MTGHMQFACPAVGCGRLVRSVTAARGRNARVAKRVKEENPEEVAPKRKAEAEAGSKKRKPKKKKQEGEAVQPEAGAVTPGASSGDNPQVAGEGGVAGSKVGKEPK